MTLAQTDRPADAAAFAPLRVLDADDLLAPAGTDYRAERLRLALRRAELAALEDSDVIAVLLERDPGYPLQCSGIGDQAERLRLYRERLAVLGITRDDAENVAHDHRDRDLAQTGEGFYRPPPARARAPRRIGEVRAVRSRAPRRSASRPRRPACRRSAARAPAGSDGGSDQPGESEAGEPPGRPTDRRPSGRSRPVAPGIAADHWVTRRRRDPMEGSR